MASRTTPSLKIGLVLDDGLDSNDGVQQYVLDLGSWLTSEGHEVRYLVGQTSRTDIPGVVSMTRNVTVTFNGNRMATPLPASRRKIRALLDQEQFDILHVQVPYSPFMAGKMIRAAGSRTAVMGTFHILPDSKLTSLANRLLGIVLRSSLRRFRAMVSVSAAAAVFAKQTYGVDSTVVPNMISYSRFHDAKPLPRFADNIPTILFLGRLVPRKGCKVLLQAVALLRENPAVPTFRVIICGKGPLEADLKAFVAQKQLNDVVIFTGFVSELDKPRYYASADISVFPSSGGESFGIVLLEAMASGKAVVLAGDNPGYSSVLADKPQLLFPARAPQVLADKLAYYLNNHAERQASAADGASFTVDFDAAVVGAQLLATYKKILQ